MSEMASDSWDAFAGLLQAEAASLAALQRSAMTLTEALVGAQEPLITAAQEELERERQAHWKHSQRRRSMQQRGFGEMSLGDVVRYAPPASGQQMNNFLADMTYSAAALTITNENNKALILHGMDRLMKVVAVLQRTATEQTGTYKRGGNIDEADGSVIVSRRA